VTTREASIDGRSVTPAPGESILAAARRVGIEIPTLCHRDGLSEAAGCRICLVEIEGDARLRAACHAALEPGRTVRTDTPRLRALRAELLALERASHPADVLGPPGERNELTRLLARCAPAPDAPAPAAPRPFVADASHPLLRFDGARCILCRRCVRACDEIQGQGVYAIVDRGGEARLAIGAADRFDSSDCTACGACVDDCPTGALFDVDRERPLPADATTVRTTCGYCGVGCQLEVTRAVQDGRPRVLQIAGAREADVNRGHLCAKGRFAHGWQAAPDRLTTPLVRRDGALVPTSWDAALAHVARRLDAIHRQHGADALGCLASSRSTNEASYLLQKLFRVRFGTNHVDCCARVCHAPTALAFALQTGVSAATASFDDVERARMVTLVGANPTEAHPVFGARLRQAVLRGAQLLVIDPRRTELCALAALHLAPRPGTNVALFHALAKQLLAAGAVDAAYVAERTEGFEAFAQELARHDAATLAAHCGVAETEIAAAAALLAGAAPPLFVHGLGLTEQTQGTEAVLALGHLALLLGAIGRPGAGMLPLRGQNNVQGAADMGCAPDRLPGYAALDDGEAGARMLRAWGAPPLPEPGLTLPEMLEAAEGGRLRALWIQGEDPMQSDPDEAHVARALEALDFLVVQELFLTETARRAEVVLPAAGFLEQDGTFTNAERRVQRVRPAVAAPGEARADWRVVADAARALGLDWRYAGPADVFDEIARVAPAQFGGLSHRRLDAAGADGIQWPCPAPDHPGTPMLHTERFARGRGRFFVIPFTPGPEHAVEGYPYALITGRVLHHYNVGTMTRRTPQHALAPEDRLEIHPADAAREGIADGGVVSLESRWGATRVRARVTGRVREGALFLSFHHPETHANRVTGRHRDPRANCPDYKETAVRIRPA